MTIPDLFERSVNDASGFRGFRLVPVPTSQDKDRILIVDDEPSVHDVLRAYLSHHGYDVVSARTGREALALAADRPPALVVLDLGLPDIPGEEVCAVLRRSSAPGIIMLTARTTEDDRILGLELGADDFVTKPYSPRELVSRVKAVLRRTSGGGPTAPEGEVLRCGERLRVDLGRHEATVDDVPLALTPAEFKLLHTLVFNAGRALSRCQLMELMSGDAYEAYERTIDAHVKNLRRKLGPGPADGQWIETVRGVGYRFVKLQASP
jgi:DNA-binding response OmpR family regulator